MSFKLLEFTKGSNYKVAEKQKQTKYNECWLGRREPATPDSRAPAMDYNRKEQLITVDNRFYMID